MTAALIMIGIIILIIILKKYTPSSTSYGSLGGVAMSQVLSSWATALPFFTMSSNDFYAEMEQSLKDHDMPKVEIARANNKEGGIFSSSREYLRIKYRDLVFDVCAAPFGKDFFVSWWMYETEGVLGQLLKHTKAGDYLKQRAARRTFYQADQEKMFRTCVHNVVLEVLERITSKKGIRFSPDTQAAVAEGGV